MKKIYLLLLVLSIQLSSFAQCIEKRTFGKTTETFYYNARNQLTKVVSPYNGKPLTTTYHYDYDAKGNCILAIIGGNYRIKGIYNDENQLVSTTRTVNDLSVVNALEYKDNQITKIKTFVELTPGVNAPAIETILTYENDNITKIEALDKASDSLTTVVTHISYDDRKNVITKEATLLQLGFYSIDNMVYNLLGLSHNNAVKFSYLNPDGNCGSIMAHLEYERQYDASQKIIGFTSKETCGKKITTTKYKIESTCK